MFRNVFLKTLRDMRVALAWWAGSMFLLCLWMITLYPSLGNDPGLQSYLENLPDSFKMLVGETITLATAEGFLTIEMYTFFLPLLTLAFALTYSGGFISREEDDGSLDLLLSNPIPRWRVVLEKSAALVVFTLAVLLACYLGFLGGAVLADVEIDSGRLLEGTLNVLPLTLFFSTLVLCITCLKRGRGLAVGVSAGLAVITYFVNGLALTVDIPEWAQKLSPWYYYAGDRVLIDGVEWGHFWLLLGLSALFVAIGTWGFQQRDLGT